MGPQRSGAPRIEGLGFPADGIEAATHELSLRGVEPDGEPAVAEELRYRHFHPPDGRVFELIDRRA